VFFIDFSEEKVGTIISQGDRHWACGINSPYPGAVPSDYLHLWSKSSKKNPETTKCFGIYV
jgi:hypothetical protein